MGLLLTPLRVRSCRYDRQLWLRNQKIEKRNEEKRVNKLLREEMRKQAEDRLLEEEKEVHSASAKTVLAACCLHTHKLTNSLRRSSPASTGSRWSPSGKVGSGTR